MTITHEQQEAFADDLRVLANMVADNPTIANAMYSQFCDYKILVPVGYIDGGPLVAMREFIRSALAADVRVGKRFDNYANVDLTFPGGITIQVYATREQVCERVVVGTETVTKQVPDPSAPLVEVTETVEQVEWRCAPLLADAESVSA